MKAIITVLALVISISSFCQVMTKVDSTIIKYNYLAGKEMMKSVQSSTISMATGAVSTFFLAMAPQISSSQERSVCYIASGAFALISVATFVQSRVYLNKAGKFLITPAGVVVKF